MERPDKKTLALSIILIIILGLIAYANSLSGQFLYDDELLIKNNTFIRNAPGIGQLFSTDIMAGVGLRSFFYRPLQMITYALDYAIWNLNAAGYHITNVFLHILAALCVFWLINILFNDNKLSLLASALFIVHPIHTEAVSYISGRTDPLSVVFMLLCFIIYTKQVDRGRTSAPGYILLLFTYALALLSKEMSVILPLLLLFYHFVFRKKIRMPEFISLLAVLAAYLAIRLTYLKSISMLPQVGSDTIFTRIPGLFEAISSYIKLLFLPFPLHMEYGTKLFGYTDPAVFIGIMITFALLSFAYIKRDNKIILFSIGWFFLALIPVSNLFRINAYMAEHFLYLPSIGFFLLIAYYLSIICRDKKYKPFGIALIIGTLLFYEALTISQNAYWKDPLTLYDRILKFAPDSVSAHYGRGIIYDKQGEYDKAVSDYSMAIRIRPDHADAYNNRGIVYDKKGDYDKAIANYDRALQIRPDYAAAYSNRKIAYNKKKIKIKRK